MTTMSTQFGIVDEVTYGTPVVVTRFFATNGVPGFEADRGFAQSEALRAGAFVRRSDGFVPYGLGASGTVEMDVTTKGFGYWLKHMLGTVAAPVGPVDANYTHTATVGSLVGDSFTAQVGRVFNPAATLQPFTYHGGKIVSWELSTDVERLLVASFDCDFEDEETATTLATASYPASNSVFAWNGASVTFGGVSKELYNFTVGMDNAPKTDKHYLRGSSLKKEPTTDGYREITWSAEMDFSDLTEYNRFVAATPAASLAVIEATWLGSFAHGGTTLPRLVVTIPAARFDEVNLSTGSEAMTQNVSGIGMWNLTDSPITISYRTTDATV